MRANEIHAAPLSFAIDPVLPQGMLTILSGKDKRGKTLLALEMIKAVLLKQPFLGRFPVNTTGPVAAYLLDDPDSLTIDRLKTLGPYEHPDLFLATMSRVDLSDAKAVLADMADEVKRVQARLVVVDALYLFTPPGRESGNDASAMRPVMLEMNRLAEETGAADLLIAHDNKSGMDVAGSHVIRAAAKSILRLDVPKRDAREAEAEDEDAAQTPRRVLKQESKLAPAQAWTLELLGTKNDYRGWRCHGTTLEARTSHVVGAVQGFIAEGECGTIEEIAHVIKHRREDVARAVDGLLEAGAVVSEPRKKAGPGRPATIYRAAEHATEFPSETNFPDGVGTEIPGPELSDMRRVKVSSRISVPRTSPSVETRDGNSPVTVELEEVGGLWETARS
ncbi:MAG: hypothetical protein A2Z31_05010 [candidate division NC10 bacterium RBG_16_65_8]|nr:MAG: hypothetical protein A2Z31_05010 [candidate division NC10 bacterium RBG_16_65_8]